MKEKIKIEGSWGHAFIVVIIAMAMGAGFNQGIRSPKYVSITATSTEVVYKPVYYDVESICKKAGGELKKYSYIKHSESDGGFTLLKNGNGFGDENYFNCQKGSKEYLWDYMTNKYFYNESVELK